MRSAYLKPRWRSLTSNNEMVVGASLIWSESTIASGLADGRVFRPVKQGDRVQGSYRPPVPQAFYKAGTPRSSFPSFEPSSLFTELCTW